MTMLQSRPTVQAFRERQPHINPSADDEQQPIDVA